MVNLLAMTGFVFRALALLVVVAGLNSCASQSTTSTAPSGPPVAGESRSGESAFNPNMGPGGAGGSVRF